MKINKKKFLLILFIVIFLILHGLSNIAFADNFDVNRFSPENEKTTGPYDLISDGVGIGLNVVRTIAAGAAIIGLTVIGIKYLTSSPEGRAGYKKAFLIYLLGFLLAVSGVEIISKLAEFGAGIGG